MMPIALATLGKCTMVGVIALGIKHAARGAIPGRVIPAQISSGVCGAAVPPPLPHNACFDGDAARLVRDEPACCEARRPAATESSPTRTAS
jgi:hypothetical protein